MSKTTDAEPITDAMAEKYTRDDEACMAEFQTTADEPTIRIGGLLSTADGPSTFSPATKCGYYDRKLAELLASREANAEPGCPMKQIDRG